MIVFHFGKWSPSLWTIHTNEYNPQWRNQGEREKSWNVKNWIKNLAEPSNASTKREKKISVEYFVYGENNNKNWKIWNQNWIINHTLYSVYYESFALLLFPLFYFWFEKFLSIQKKKDPIRWSFIHSKIIIASNFFSLIWFFFIFQSKVKYV